MQNTNDTRKKHVMHIVGESKVKIFKEINYKFGAYAGNIYRLDKHVQNNCCFPNLFNYPFTPEEMNYICLSCYVGQSDIDLSSVLVD